MRSHAVAVVVLFVASCDSQRSASSCAGLEDQLQQVIATRGTCATAADCELVAGAEYDACDGEGYMITCGGVPVERNAPGRARAEELTHEFFDGQCDMGKSGAYDCAPSELQCDTDHHCVAVTRSCLPGPPE